jgi:hypothetical protein
VEAPKEFDTGFQITCNTEYGKGDLIFSFMEFIGWFELTHGENCYTPMLREVYAAIKAGTVKGLDKNEAADKY